MNKNIRRLTEGAMMCALVGLLLVVNRYLMESLEMVLLWVIPLPVIVYVVRYDLRNGMVLSFCIAAISFILALPQTVFYSLSGCIVGLVYGYGVINNKSSNWLVSTTIVGSIFVSAVTILLFASFFGYDLTTELLSFSGVVAPVAKLLSNGALINADFIKILFYLFIIVYGILEGTVIHLITYIVLRKLRIEAPIPKVVILSKGPKWLGYGCIGVILLNWLAPNFTQSTQILEILLFITVILCFVVGWFGYIMLLVFIKRLGVGFILTILIALALIFIFGSLLMLGQAILIFLVGLGLLDMTTNIRNILMGVVK